jgi:hypothetical protein
LNCPGLHILFVFEKNADSFYWLFSSIAQTIASFVAFLLTGFALVLNMMDSLEQKDETLAEIHIRLKKSCYNRIILLSVISALAIIFSLSMLYVNKIDLTLKPALFLITSALSLLAIILAIAFVLSIINPERYKTAAKEILKEDKEEFSRSGNTVDQVNFLHEFADLEKHMRYIIKNHNLQPVDTARQPNSFRQMASTLYENELISREMLYELLQINKYRNLVYHGHLTKVDQAMLDRLVHARESIADMAYTT